MTRRGTEEFNLKSHSSLDKPKVPQEPVKPKPNLKKLHWIKKPAAENTVWGQIENDL